MNATRRGRLWIPEAPHLICNPTRELAATAQAVGVSGRFESVELVHARTGCVVQRCEFDNLITDAGLNAIGGTGLGSLIQFCAVGTGSRTPAFSDASLEAEVGRTNNNGGFGDAVTTGPSYGYYERKITRVFSQAQANGNLSEVGMWSASTGGTLWCRQLIRDAGGNPTTITKTADFELRVVYAWRIYTSAAVTETVARVNGADQTVRNQHHDVSYIVWQYMLHEMGGSWTTHSLPAVGNGTTLPPVTGSWSNTQTSLASSMAAAPYVSGSFYRDFEYTWLADRANFTIGLVLFRGMGGGRGEGVTQFTAPFTKTNTQKLVIGARFPWARHAI